MPADMRAASKPIELRVDLKERSYPIYIGRDILGDGTCLAPYIPGNQVFIVTNETVGPLYLQTLTNALSIVLEPGCQIDEWVIPDGEIHKTLDTYRAVIDALIASRHDRSTTIIALGGGVVGDIAGFVAATYQRGVNFIQIPTTLLAQVDSSVGGKTGVNHTQGKNLIGSFYQPSCVLADIGVLDTLPEREYLAGLAEVIKYGVIADSEFFSWLEDSLAGLRAKLSEVTAEAILRCCRIKASVVARDERETGLRAILNFGHTFGHALEKITRYETYLHGEAVAIGMVLAMQLSRLSLGTSEADVQRLSRLLTNAGLPVKLPEGLDLAEFLNTMSLDKKVHRGCMRFVLVERLGRAQVSDEVDPEAVERVLLSSGLSTHD